MFEVIPITDKLKWNSIINKFENRDIYFISEYFQSAKLIDEGFPELFYYEDDNGILAYPYIKREVISNSLENYYDITSVYGYGGVLLLAYKDNLKLLNEFREQFNEYCKTQNIVSEFTRFHPLIKNQKNLNNKMEIIPLSNTLAMELQSTDQLMDAIPANTRNKIRKAMKNEVSIKQLCPIENVEVFQEIYYSTMNRKQANHFYYFNKKYFENLFLSMDKNIFMFGAYYEDKLISLTLILKYRDFVHYHLSGSLKDYLWTRANYLLLFKVAEWGKLQKCKIFHLGGGYSGENDSLYQFKKSFTKLKPLEYCIGKKVHSEKIYNELVKEKDIDIASNFFPLYRS